MKNKITIDRKELEDRVFEKDQLIEIMQREGWKVVERIFNREKNKLQEDLANKKFKDISEVLSVQETIKKIDEIWNAINNVVDEGNEAIKTLDEKYEKY